MSKKFKKQILSLVIPIIWNILYLIFKDSFDKSYRVYYDLVFYTVLAIYFIAIGSISFRCLWNEWKKGKQFWFPVLFCIIAMVISFGVGIVISALLPNINDGMGVLKVVDLPSLFAFALTTIFLPPIAEEAFYRKGIINFDNKILLILTSIIGIILYACEHSLKPVGLLIASIWAIPFTIFYIKSKNIYIPMTAHFLCNLIMNSLTVIFVAIKLL